MIRILNAWLTILLGIGPAIRLGRQVDEIFRFYVIDALAKEGVLDYLKEPRAYGQILAEFDFVDSKYTRELFDVLVNDRHPILVQQDNLFRVNSEEVLPDLGKIIARTDKKIRDASLMAQGIARYIPNRLRDQSVEFTSSFEQNGRHLLISFNQVLGLRVYSSIRNGAFALLTREERKWLRGKKLLEVGCGSGRETAELWTKLGGDIQLTAVDAVPAMLELAEQNFATMLAEIHPSRPPLTRENTPVFKQASATHLPFEDNHFDAIFYSLLLHWTADPRRAIKEFVRVVKPGGLIFGSQGCKPYLNPYFDIVIRTNQNCYGIFWQEEYQRWYAEYGLMVEMQTPAGVFRVHKPK
jgi:ubiquinone/menaquinone biosynthesis C-methylase UbiE